MAYPRIALVSLLLLVAACILPAPAESKTDTASVIAKFKEKDPGLAKIFDEAHGYAVYPTVGKGAFGIGGAHGKGEVFERGVLIGTSTLSQLTIGFQFGGQAYSEVIFFKDKTALDDFKRGNFELNAQVSAIALTERASRDLAYNRGVAIVTMGKGGLMYEASVGGQKFSFKPLKSK
ncbi:MAG TPA: lipid-binding SYLF domain-containing protein [Candidatus Eisenbacteria bacterium]|nr:lipid-binding SYLF domain-containing protein [Candidatus Eisenbacteria bacterium]